MCSLRISDIPTTIAATLVVVTVRGVRDMQEQALERRVASGGLVAFLGVSIMVELLKKHLLKTHWEETCVGTVCAEIVLGRRGPGENVCPLYVWLLSSQYSVFYIYYGRPAQ